MTHQQKLLGTNGLEEQHENVGKAIENRNCHFKILILI